MDSQPAKGFVMVVTVNFTDSVFDTDQISIIRGGSELARWLPYHVAGCDYQAPVEGIKDGYNSGNSLRVISLGGSRGLYECDSPDETAADLKQYLKNHPTYRHLSVFVAVCKAAEVRVALPHLMAGIAWQQMQSHRVRPDPVECRGEVCQLTGVRAAGSTRAFFPPKGTDEGRKLELAASESSLARLKFGRHLRKNGLLLSVVSAAKTSVFDDYHLSNNFEEIADSSGEGKVAYIYWDGNGFGHVNRKAEAAATIADWDSYLRTKRAELMHDIIESGERLGLLDSGSSDPETGLLEPRKKTFRVEPLLWGGDESMLVVPAAAALRLMSFIQRRTCQWRFNFYNDQGEKQPDKLTHAFALLFCSAKTPVREARAMAENLAELTKQQEHGRSCDSWSFAVLNSIDYEPEANMNRYLTTRFGGELKRELSALRFPPSSTGFLQNIIQLTTTVSRGHIRRLATSACSAEPHGSEEFEFALKRMHKLAGKEQSKRLHVAIESIVCDLNAAETPATERQKRAVWALLEELYAFLPSPNIEPSKVPA